jgi:ferrous iron transport protein B
VLYRQLWQRNIENWKERLITILVTPFTTCSARLPVYAIIIALVIRIRMSWDFNLQGLTLMLLYLIGFAMAIFSAYILNIILKIKCKTFFVVEMPSYKLPLFKTLHSMLLKNKSICFWCRKNNFSYINRAMVYGFLVLGKRTIEQNRKMQEYHKRN